MQLFGFIILCVIWGTTWMAIKFSLQGIPPLFGAAIRFSIATLIVGGLIIIKKIPLKVPKKVLGLMAICGFLMYVIDYGLIYWGEQHLSGGVTAIFFATLTIFTAVWSNFFIKNEVFNIRKFAGLLLGLIGILIVFYNQLVETDFNRLVTLASLGIIVSAAGGSLSNVIIKKYMFEINPYVITFYQMSIGVFFLILLAFGLEDVHSIHLNWKVIAGVLYLAIAGSAFAFVLHFKLLKEMSVITLSLIVYVTPIVALVTDYFVFGEIISRISFVGMVIIFLGIALTQRKPKKVLR